MTRLLAWGPVTQPRKSLLADLCIAFHSVQVCSTYLHDEAVGGREAEPVSRGGKEDGRRGQQMQEVHGDGLGGEGCGGGEDYCLRYDRNFFMSSIQTPDEQTRVQDRWPFPAVLPTQKVHGKAIVCGETHCSKS